MADVSLNATANDQLEAIRGQQQNYTQRLETNTTKQENVGRGNIADSAEAQKQRAREEAMAAGRPWTNADEQQWADRTNRDQTRAANERLLGREENVGRSINAQLPTVNSQIGQMQGQQGLQLQAAGQAAAIKQSQAELQAQQEYQQAMLKMQQQQQAQQQVQQLSQLMYGPAGPAPTQRPAAPVYQPQPAPRPVAAGGGGGGWGGQAQAAPAAQQQAAAINPLSGFGSSYNAYASQMGRR